MSILVVIDKARFYYYGNVAVISLVHVYYVPKWYVHVYVLPW